MYEVPELEILRRDCEREVVGRKVKSLEVATTALLKGVTKKTLTAKIEGAKLTHLNRRGEWLLFSIDKADIMALHVGTATLRKCAPKDPIEKSTALCIRFTQGGDLRLLDPDKTATLRYTNPENLLQDIPELANLGMDPAADAISWVKFGQALIAVDGKLKNILMDPTFLVGIGPIYSDEILFEAGLRYDRRPRSMSSQEIRRLYRAVVEVIHEATKARGTSLEKRPFSDLSGKMGEFQDQLKVYGRDGLPSPRARGLIVKARVGNQTTYFCEQSQV